MLSIERQKSSHKRKLLLRFLSSEEFSSSQSIFSSSSCSSSASHCSVEREDKQPKAEEGQSSFEAVDLNSNNLRSQHRDSDDAETSSYY